ncbi:Hypothetical predicted protein [Mytilus galloprovincialis]|uniref:Uncharacterized protein n=1 Tax=Mytilus galloprovincialis TaxID=29158 RepID=A0A8B6C080_MYTGA|nr:Hypothetical predicted protein [Mytilus galloprovincialis]
MQTLAQHPKTDTPKRYSVITTEKQRKQTPLEISTTYITDLTKQTKQHFSISTITQDASDTINKTIVTVILGFSATTIIIAVLRRLKGYWITLRKIRHKYDLEAEKVNDCVYNSIDFISSLSDDNSKEDIFRNIPPHFQHFTRLDVAYQKECSIDTIIQTKIPSPDTICTIEEEC